MSRVASKTKKGKNAMNTNDLNVTMDNHKEQATLAPCPCSASGVEKRIIIESDNTSLTVTMPNELTERENDRLSYGLRQALKELRDKRKAKPLPNDGR